MSFFKKIKKKMLRIVDPVMGKKVGDTIFGKDKKDAPVDPGKDVFGNTKQNDEYYQNELGKEGENWRNAPTAQRQSVVDASKAAGTYADTREGNASVDAEAAARTRGVQAASLNRINLLRKQLGLPESQTV